MSRRERAILIPVEGEPEEVVIDLDNLAAIRKAIGGGWVENVTVSYLAATGLEVGQREVALLVDEEGLIKGLPLNRLATPFYCPNPRNGIIAGAALLVGQDEGPEGWDWAGLPGSITVEKVEAAAAFAMRHEGVSWA